MKQSKRLLDRLMQAAEVHNEPLPGVPLLELSGQRRVLIENHHGVTQYSREEICVKVCFGLFCICGTGLELACMSKERLVITGCIETVQLLKGRT